MRQMTLKFNTYVKSVNIINNGAEKIIFNVIIWSFGILALFYVVFLGNMVKNIVERKSLETNALTLSSEVRDLELTYLSMSNNVDLAFSYSKGFKEIQATFATHKSLGLISNSGLDNVKTAKNDL